ncbi:MAG: glycoside hydrolase family 2 TIM barrel-domain containing protein [Steroidobacter sp.]
MSVNRYPRPLLRRSQWQSLNGSWKFLFDDEMRHRAPEDVGEWPLVIQVPFAPEARLSGIGDTGFHRCCWYQRTFDISREPGSGTRVILHFGAVDFVARVWVNDLPVVEHEGGHTPFRADITHALQPGAQQCVTVQVEDDPHDLEKPRGKQDWRLEPHSIWYPRTTGIWQTVWLEQVAATYVGVIQWTPNVERWEVAMHAFICGDERRNLRLSVQLRAGEQILAHDTYQVMTDEVHRRIGLSDPGIEDFRNELLWSPERPTLIDVEVRLLDSDGVVLDEFTSYTALRAIGAQRERLMLNGRPITMRMVLDQGYWPDSLMTAPSDEALRRDVELAKQMGFNGVRKHQKIEDPRYLYWADKLGLLVWEEMPSAYRFTRKAVRRMVREWTEAIERDSSHPCIVIWVPFNESWGVPDLTTVPAARDAVAAMYHLTKTLDPTRLVIGNDGWESSATDVIGMHDYDCDPLHMRARYGPEVKPQEVVDRRWTGGRILTLDGYPHRGQPICLTEFGGISYHDPDRYAGREWGYQSAQNKEDFARVVLSVLEVAATTAMFSGFCYTQFADTFQEANGLLYEDRTPKIPLERIAAAVRGEAQ